MKTDDLVYRPKPDPALDHDCAIALTKREYFAAMAVQSFIGEYGPGEFEKSAKAAVALADALIKQLNKEATE